MRCGGKAAPLGIRDGQFTGPSFTGGHGDDRDAVEPGAFVEEGAIGEAVPVFGDLE